MFQSDNYRSSKFTKQTTDLKTKVERTCITSLDGLRFPAVEKMGQLYGIKGALGPFPYQVGANVERRHDTFPDDAKGKTTVSIGRVRASHWPWAINRRLRDEARSPP